MNKDSLDVIRLPVCGYIVALVNLVHALHSKALDCEALFYFGMCPKLLYATLFILPNKPSSSSSNSHPAVMIYRSFDLGHVQSFVINTLHTTTVV